MHKDFIHKYAKLLLRKYQKQIYTKSHSNFVLKDVIITDSIYKFKILFFLKINKLNLIYE